MPWSWTRRPANSESTKTIASRLMPRRRFGSTRAGGRRAGRDGRAQRGSVGRAGGRSLVTTAEGGGLDVLARGTCGPGPRGARGARGVRGGGGGGVGVVAGGAGGAGPGGAGGAGGGGGGGGPPRDRGSPGGRPPGLVLARRGCGPGRRPPGGRRGGSGAVMGYIRAR